VAIKQLNKDFLVKKNKHNAAINPHIAIEELSANQFGQNFLRIVK
jgi:hypothetical protein